MALRPTHWCISSSPFESPLVLRVAAFGSLTVEDAEAMLRGLDVIICKHRSEHPYSPPDVIANDASSIRSPSDFCLQLITFRFSSISPLMALTVEYMRMHILPTCADSKTNRSRRTR